MNEIWKKPARLWRRRGRENARSEASAVTQLGSGSLEAMVRAAIETEAEHSDDQATLFIDVEAKRMLSLSEIKRLRGSPEFPIEI